jgi:Ser/Thr protein kinase RdoA (MazF antagonist)
MFPAPADEDARAVLGRYRVAAEVRGVEPLGNRGGFSGARLWRCAAGPSAYCLRAWPAGSPAPERLGQIHVLMTSALRAGLAFVPEVLGTRAGGTWVGHAGRLWDLTLWKPGAADFCERPSPARLSEAGAALARVHEVWRRSRAEAGPCPAVGRRLDAARGWQQLARAGWRPDFAAAVGAPFTPWAERAWQMLAPWVARLPALLAPWQGRALPLQPCLCDVWHDHLLFQGDRLTGLVDYGAVKVDHVAVDLARMLGSMVGDDEEGWALGLRAYRTVRPLSEDEEALAVVLDRTGTVIGAANWLRWLYHDGRRYPDPHAVARRLAALVERMEGW